MRLVTDREWHVCYIEVTKAEVELLRWPPRGVPSALLTEKPAGLESLEDQAYKLAREARPFYETIYRAERPANTLCGIEARIVD